jgi:hypothetical protein
MMREITNEKDGFQQELKASELLSLLKLVPDTLWTDTVDICCETSINIWWTPFRLI